MNNLICCLIWCQLHVFMECGLSVLGILYRCGINCRGRLVSMFRPGYTSLLQGNEEDQCNLVEMLAQVYLPCSALADYGEPLLIKRQLRMLLQKGTLGWIIFHFASTLLK